MVPYFVQAVLKSKEKSKIENLQIFGRRATSCVVVARPAATFPGFVANVPGEWEFISDSFNYIVNARI